MIFFSGLHWQGPNHDKLTEHNYALKNCKNPDDVAKLANNTIMVAIQIAKAKVGTGNGQGIQPTPQAETQADSNQPMGLSRLTAESTIGKYETSVEDRVKRGWIGTGMRTNFGATSRPVILRSSRPTASSLDSSTIMTGRNKTQVPWQSIFTTIRLSTPSRNSSTPTPNCQRQ